jgi:hypothetical protein
MHKLHKKLDELASMLNPPAPPRVIWLNHPDERAKYDHEDCSNTIFVRWMTAEEAAAGLAFASRAVD